MICFGPTDSNVREIFCRPHRYPNRMLPQAEKGRRWCTCSIPPFACFTLSFQPWRHRCQWGSEEEAWQWPPPFPTLHCTQKREEWNEGNTESEGVSHNSDDVSNNSDDVSHYSDDVSNNSDAVGNESDDVSNESDAVGNESDCVTGKAVVSMWLAVPVQA